VSRRVSGRISWFLEGERQRLHERDQHNSLKKTPNDNLMPLAHPLMQKNLCERTKQKKKGGGDEPLATTDKNFN